MIRIALAFVINVDWRFSRSMNEHAVQMESGQIVPRALEVEEWMLEKCANPACLTRFHYLESGALFRLENEPRNTPDQTFREYFWLCSGCSPGLTLRLNSAGRLRVAEGTTLPERGDDVLDFVPLDRRYGMLLSRVTLFRRHGRRREKTEGGLVHA